MINKSEMQETNMLEHKYNIFARLDRMPRRAALSFRRRFHEKTRIGTATWYRWEKECLKGVKADIDGYYLKIFADMFDVPMDALINEPKKMEL